MPYRFRLQEPLEDGVRRIAREQLGRAIAGFAPDKSRDAAIHDARRRLKKVRALLRLVRTALGDKTFRIYNWELRDAGMLLSGPRDLFVMESTLNTLDSRALARAKGAVSAARCVVLEAQEKAQAEVNAAAVDEGVERIRTSLQSIASLDCADLDISDLSRGLKQCYADCRKSFRAACEADDDEGFHEWRKTTQRHWRQLLLMKAAWRDFFEARARLVERVSGLLGEDHDLAILKTFSAASIGKGLTPKQSETIFALAQERQGVLRDEAKQLAATMFAASPKSLARETKMYWKAALEKPENIAKRTRAHNQDSETGNSHDDNADIASASESGALFEGGLTEPRRVCP